ncbi:hypothetical protein HDU96_008434 [Phlyctochytrium bullatum]|nr:hypothetical protein HDU96_008434 [Phlyctochytrium bullatum]
MELFGVAIDPSTTLPLIGWYVIAYVALIHASPLLVAIFHARDPAQHQPSSRSGQLAVAAEVVAYGANALNHCSVLGAISPLCNPEDHQLTAFDAFVLFAFSRALLSSCLRAKYSRNFKALHPVATCFTYLFIGSELRDPKVFKHVLPSMALLAMVAVDVSYAAYQEREALPVASDRDEKSTADESKSLLDTGSH